MLSTTNQKSHRSLLHHLVSHAHLALSRQFLNALLTDVPSWRLCSIIRRLNRTHHPIVTIDPFRIESLLSSREQKRSGLMGRFFVCADKETEVQRRVFKTTKRGENNRGIGLLMNLVRWRKIIWFNLENCIFYSSCLVTWASRQKSCFVALRRFKSYGLLAVGPSHILLKTKLKSKELH